MTKKRNGGGGKKRMESNVNEFLKRKTQKNKPRKVQKNPTRGRGFK